MVPRPSCSATDYKNLYDRESLRRIWAGDWDTNTQLKNVKEGDLTAIQSTPHFYIAESCLGSLYAGLRHLGPLRVERSCFLVEKNSGCELSRKVAEVVGKALVDAGAQRVIYCNENGEDVKDASGDTSNSTVSMDYAIMSCNVFLPAGPISDSLMKKLWPKALQLVCALGTGDLGASPMADFETKNTALTTIPAYITGSGLLIAENESAKGRFPHPMLVRTLAQQKLQLALFARTGDNRKDTEIRDKVLNLGAFSSWDGRDWDTEEITIVDNGCEGQLVQTLRMIPAPVQNNNNNVVNFDVPMGKIDFGDRKILNLKDGFSNYMSTSTMASGAMSTVSSSQSLVSMM